MKKIAVFVSGSGSDMQSVIDATESGYIDARVVCVVSSKPAVFALERAAKHGIPSRVFALSDFGKDAEARDRAVAEWLRGFEPDLVVLAGYLGIVTPSLVREYAGRMINIHPSLIPLHCGKGMYGLRVHEDVLRSGDKVSGATVHFVDEGTDTGEIIVQQRVRVEGGDTPESLQARVLKVEHKLLPYAVKFLCEQD